MGILLLTVQKPQQFGNGFKKLFLIHTEPTSRAQWQAKKSRYLLHTIGMAIVLCIGRKTASCLIWNWSTYVEVPSNLAFCNKRLNKGARWLEVHVCLARME